MTLDKQNESERKYRLLIENIPSVVWVTDQSGHTTYISPNIKKIYGFSTEEILEAGEALWLDRIHPEDRETVLTAFQELFTKKAPFDVEYRIKHRDGHWVWLHDRANRVDEVDGQARAFGVFSDISEQKNAEIAKRELEEQLQQAEKLEAIGQLAGGVAHDFNNQLGGVLGYADLLREIVKDDSEALDYVNRIIHASERAADLTAKLLAFARKGKYTNMPVDIHALIQEVVSLLKHSADKKIVIKQKLNAQRFITVGEASQLQNAVVNLGINACHAMPNGGELVFATEVVELDDRVCESAPFEMSSGKFISVTISDTGTGMSKKVKDRIFEPFFTTKESGKGTGMGLSAVWGTMTTHGGSIEVESEPGQGTAFKLLLPILEKESIEPFKSEVAPSAVREAQVLVVDDEPMICETASAMLKSLGYKVMTARDGDEAVTLFEKHALDIDVVILDVVMPKRNGRESFEAFVKIDPNVKVLVSTGYSVEGEARAILEIGAAGFLSKPFRKRELAQKVADALVLSTH